MALKKSYPTTASLPITAYHDDTQGLSAFVNPDNILLDDDNLTTITLAQDATSFALVGKFNYDTDSGLGFGDEGDIEGIEVTLDIGGSASGVHKLIIQGNFAGLGTITLASGELSSLGITDTISEITVGSATNILTTALSSDYQTLSSDNTFFINLSATNSHTEDMSLSANFIKAKVHQVSYKNGRANYKYNQLHWLGY